VEESCDFVNSLIQKEVEKGVDPSKVILCGFSQGAGIAIHTGFGREVPIGGVISLCGCLPNDAMFTVKEQAKHTPVM
jgi:singapore isolate B (sub-type 7) whole genome shotgun sequence assembly, scaffold_0